MIVWASRKLGEFKNNDSVQANTLVTKCASGTIIC